MNSNNVSISELKSVRVVTGIFLLIFLGSFASIAVTYKNDMSFNFDFSANGWSFLLVLFDFPLKAAAAYAAIVGLLSLNHRSEQTKQQLSLARAQVNASNEQNRFTNYYKHLEEFDKYISVLNEEKGLNLRSRQSHAKLFPNLVHSANYQIKQHLLDDIVLHLEKVVDELSSSRVFNASSAQHIAFMVTSFICNIRTLIGRDISPDAHSERLELVETGWNDGSWALDYLLSECCKEFLVFEAVLAFDTTTYSLALSNLSARLQSHIEIFSSFQNITVNSYGQEVEGPYMRTKDEFLIYVVTLTSFISDFKSTRSET